MTLREACVRLHALQGWLRLPLAKDGRPYGPGFFAKRRWEETLQYENRRVTLRLARLPCVRCGEPLPNGSTGDHLIPLAQGGPPGAQNYVPLCPRCNASKGTRDFIDWWVESGKSAADLPLDVLCAYARLRYQLAESRGELDAAASAQLEAAVEAFEPALPSAAHWRAVRALP